MRFLPFLSTAGVLSFSWALYGTNDFQSAPVRALARLIAGAAIGGAAATPAAVVEYADRLAWSALAGLYMVCLIAAAVGVGWIGWRLTTPSRRCGVAAGSPWLLVLAAGVAVMAWFVAAHVSYGAISLTLFGPTVFAQAPDLPGRQQFFSSAGQIAALCLAALASLVPPAPGCADVRCLRDRVALLNAVLAIATGLLVVDVLREDALFRWATAFIDPGNAAAASAVQSFAATAVAVRGLFETVLLAAIYLPAAATLKACVSDAVPPSLTTAPEATRWLQNQGLAASSGIAQLRPIVAVLLPLLAGMLSGPAGAVVKGLTGS